MLGTGRGGAGKGGRGWVGSIPTQTLTEDLELLFTVRRFVVVVETGSYYGC